MGRPKGSKNKNSLAKRTPTEAPKPRNKEAPEPDTYLCKGPETIVDKSGPLLGVCTACGIFPANSEIDHLCLGCHKEAAGLVFDEEQVRWVKKAQGRK